MSNGRALFTPPPFAPLEFGLLSAGLDRSAEAPSHWQAGITWSSYCPVDSDATYDPCLTVIRDAEDPTIVDPDNRPDTPQTKLPTAVYNLRGAVPFAVYARIDCSAPGFWDNANSHAEAALAQSEGRAIARVLATGEAFDENGLPIETIFPHLQANQGLVDSTGAVLQTVATELATAAVDIVEAIGLIEEALGLCYGGQGVIHVPSILAASLADANLLNRRGAVLSSPLGHTYSISAGYPGDSPGGAETDEFVWIYATGPVFYLRSPVTVHGQVESFNRSNNTVEALVERRYVVAWDCCHFAVPVTTGGISAGTVEAST